MARDAAVAGRYAQALFNVALGRNVLERAGEDVKALLALDAKDPSLRLFLESPQVRDDHKHALVDSVLGSRVDRTVTEFVHLLLRKKRFLHLVEMAHKFEELIEAHQGIGKAHVLTAVPLTDAESKALVRELETLTRQKVRLLAKVEPGIIGGVVVRLGDRIIDRSVSSLLSQMREDLLNAPVA